jgi:hypothetical protein
MGGGATSRADGQAIDGTGTSDSYEVTGLPGWLPHRTSRQVRRKDTAPGRIGSGNRRVRPVLVRSRNHQWQQILLSLGPGPWSVPLGLTLIEAQKYARRAEQLAVLKTFAEGELLRRLPFRNLVGGSLSCPAWASGR